MLSNQWERGRYTVRHNRRQLSMMVNGTLYSSRSGSPIPIPSFIGNRRMETCLEQPSYMEQACRHLKPLENLGLKPSATQITVSTMDTCCFVLKNNRNV